MRRPPEISKAKNVGGLNEERPQQIRKGEGGHTHTKSKSVAILPRKSLSPLSILSPPPSFFLCVCETFFPLTDRLPNASEPEPRALSSRPPSSFSPSPVRRTGGRTGRVSVCYQNRNFIFKGLPPPPLPLSLSLTVTSSLPGLRNFHPPLSQCKQIRRLLHLPRPPSSLVLDTASPSRSVLALAESCPPEEQRRRRALFPPSPLLRFVNCQVSASRRRNLFPTLRISLNRARRGYFSFLSSLVYGMHVPWFLFLSEGYAERVHIRSP